MLSDQRCENHSKDLAALFFVYAPGLNRLSENHQPRTSRLPMAVNTSRNDAPKRDRAIRHNFIGHHSYVSAEAHSRDCVDGDVQVGKLVWVRVGDRCIGFQDCGVEKLRAGAKAGGSLWQ